MMQLLSARTARLALAVLLATSVTQATWAHDIDAEAEAALAALVTSAHLETGAASAADTLAAIVDLATVVHNQHGQWLLPTGTVVDDVHWEGNVVHVALTVPPAAVGTWVVSPIDAATLTAVLGGPFAADDAFGGVVIRVRAGAEQPYGTLEQFMIDQAPAEDPTLQPRERPSPLIQTGVTPTDPRLGGPSTNAARQPTGPLTGVTVYITAGHGWTAATSGDWFLQRPVLLGMAEDYGNIDMINYFAHYCFNAGATVATMRPIGWQPIEIVLDNDDPGVTFSGAWNNGDSPKYYENHVTNSGIVYKWTSAATTESAVARYSPNITVSDYYPVYCFTIAGSNRTLQTYRVKHSGGVAEVKIDHRETGSGWIWLGEYYLQAGGENWVEISNASPVGGAIVADAIRWGCGVGDIVRPGPGTVSGYTRDEEAQRYFAESELGNNAVGFDSDIWDISGSDDASDNVRSGAKWAREMNQVPAGGIFVDRWKRVHLEFHTNASTGAARGQLTLITDLGATTNQVQYATILSDEVDNDLLIADDEFEHLWEDRGSPTFTGAYGAIATGANSNEFDATLVELAFHDNQQDAELLRDPRVRKAMGRACLHGVIRFLNTLPGSQVALNFLPDTPRNFRLAHNGSGSAVLSWQAPLSDGARGDPATGYVVYQSPDGYGFGDPLILGNVTTTTIVVPPGETRFFRIAATNAGGESPPSEVLAFRGNVVGQPQILIVNGFDRLRRTNNPTQTFSQPAAYANKTIERQIWRRSNAFNYTVQHALALADNGWGFASCSNDAIINALVSLTNYDMVLWIAGTDDNLDGTLNGSERTRVQDFLSAGGGLFISGSNIGYDLVGQSTAPTFLQNTLQCNYVQNSAGTFQVTSAASGILKDIGAFDFDPANGAPYRVADADVLSNRPNALVCLNYVGSGGAGVQYQGPVYHAVTFGFPFETITSRPIRAAIMGKIVDFLAASPGPLPFDANSDGDVDFADFQTFLFCFQGPDKTYPDGHFCRKEDGDGDADSDLADLALLQVYFTGPL